MASPRASLLQIRLSSTSAASAIVADPMFVVALFGRLLALPLPPGDRFSRGEPRYEPSAVIG
jgi:hypothetical protein